MIHWFDLFTAFFLFASAVWSFYRGFTREIFSVASLVGGGWVGFRYYDRVSPWFSGVVPDETLQEILAFALLFVLTAIAIALTGILVRRILHLSHALNKIDRIAGIGVGIVKGALILAILALPAGMIPELGDGFVEGSKAAPAFIGMSMALVDKMAPELARSARAAAEKGGRARKKIEEAERYREKIKELEKKAGGLREKLGLGSGNEKSRKGNGEDKITEQDKTQLDELIKKMDKN